MRSDWHRYNLKRRITSLPPISSEVFTEKVLTAQASSSAAAAKASFERSCETCQKTYFSENAYQDHLGSRKHKLKSRFAFQGDGINDEPDTNSATSPGTETNQSSATEERDPEAEAEFDKLVEGMKTSEITDSGTIPKRQSRPHHSAAEKRAEHPLSPEVKSSNSKNLDQTSDSQVDVPLTKCFFCNYESPTSTLSLSHMGKIHGLFIPEKDYLVDLQGLLRYLQAKVLQNYECLFCHKLKGTAPGVQTHMRDKGHCRIGFESEEEMVEIGQFYNFTSTYSDDESEDVDPEEELDRIGSGGVKLPAEKANDEDDGWETGSSLSSIDSTELTSVPIDDHSRQYSKLPLHRHHSHHDPRPHRNVDGFHSHAHHGSNAVFYDDSELHLPTGRTAGHRNFRKYFRQNLTNYLSPAEKMERSQKLLEEAANTEGGDQAEPSHLEHKSQALSKRSAGGMIGATDAQKKDVRSAETRGRRQAQRSQNQYQARLEQQNNHQKHFRVSLTPDFVIFAWQIWLTYATSGPSSPMISQLQPPSSTPCSSLPCAQWCF